MYFKFDIMFNVVGKLCNSNFLFIFVLVDIISMVKFG